MALTSTYDLVDDPSELGLEPDRVDALLQRIRREVDAGIVPSCQLALARHGRLGVFVTIGDASPTTRYLVFSCTKAVVAGAVWMLIGEGRLDVSARVADLIPEFGTNGKDVVTVEQVMLHTSGFPHAPLGQPDWFTREGRLATFSKWRLNWEPGTAHEYHPTSAHWVLAELIERLGGMDYRDFIRTRITEPLGLPTLQLGVPPDQQAGIAEIRITGEPPTAEELQAVLGVSKLPVTEVTDEALVSFNQPEVRSLGVPGGGAVMTAADLALYYQALLHDEHGLWDRDVLADATSRVRNSFPDPWTGVPANRSLGVIVAGDDGKSSLRGFGKTVSGRAFGHDGAGGQQAWADPETGISLCYVTNGMDSNLIRQWRRGTAISSLAGSCATPV